MLEIAAILLGSTALAGLVLLLLRGRLLPAAGERPNRDGKEGGRSGTGNGRPRIGEGKARPEPLPGRCPLCSSRLEAGERIKSALFPGTGDRIMHVSGCPHCWPPLEGRPERSCPVCGRILPAEGYAIARYFEKPGRKHVHLLGCTECRGRR